MVKLPFGIDINNLIDNLKVFSWEAADILLFYSNILKDSNKRKDLIKNLDHENPVTLADLKVNKLIINRIKEKYNDINWEILSEENAKNKLVKFNINADWVWVIDPLDGTKDFIQGSGNYAMHIALNFKNKPIIGVVLIPEKDEFWFAYGERVWCEKRDGLIIKPNLSKNKTLKDMILVTSKNHRNETLKNLIQKINFSEVKVMGSIGCKIASIVRGESDIYICLSLPGKTSPKDWDFAAPEVILKSSGGSITNLDNQELTYGKKDFAQGGVIVASNNKNTHKSLCLEIKEIIRKYNLYPLNS